MAGERQRSWIDLKPASNGIEWASAFFRGLAFSPHRHDTYAIGYTTAGVQAFDYRGEGRHSCAGDAFILHPDELHDGRQGTDEGYGYRIVYLAPDLVRDALDGAALPFVAEAVTRDPRMKQAIANTFPDPDVAWDEMGRTGAITVLADGLSKLARQGRKDRIRVDLAGMRRIRDRLTEQAPASIGMAALEREQGMDRYMIFRQFRLAFGVSPHRFLTMRRLDIAKRHIGQGQSLAEASAAAGFADQSHMTRQFRNAFGLSPGTWRNLLSG